MTDLEVTPDEGDVIELECKCCGKTGRSAPGRRDRDQLRWDLPPGWEHDELCAPCAAKGIN